MNRHDFIRQTMLEEGFVVLYRHVAPEKMPELSRRLAAAGVRFLEVTFDQCAQDPIAQFRQAVETVRGAVGDRLILGAGTVLTPAQVVAVHDNGGEFILSPNTNDEVIRMTRKLGMVSVPGPMTPTEVEHAWEAGADIVKLFPADDLGYHYIRNLRGPLPHIPLMCTGGVNPTSIPEFFRAGANAVGTGASITKRELLDADDFDGIEALAREHVEAVRKVKTELGL